ncbi:hypothetical protein [Pseudomonas nitroreducens]|nr:hypothetical protein [Pseudomonas nitroreducens]MCP1625292.1 hypothetical protein [Pseudomonas nitroreducens]
MQLFPQLQAPARQVHLLYASDRRMSPWPRSFVDQAVAELGV